MLSRRLRSLVPGAALVLGLGAMPSSHAGVLVLETEIVSMELEGTGLVPLASDPAFLLPGTIEGYGFVESAFQATESAAFQSIGTTTVGFDATTGETTVAVDYNLFLDLHLADIDLALGRDFAAGLPTTLLATEAMTYSQTATLNAFDFLAALAALPPGATEADFWNAMNGIVSLSPVVETAAVYSLGVDVNSNGHDDVLKLRASDISVDPTTVSYELIGGAFDDVITAILGDGVTTFDAQVAVESANVVFSGDVLDAIADPPFTIDARGGFTSSTPTRTLPEPGTALLLLGGLALLWSRRPRPR